MSELKTRDDVLGVINWEGGILEAMDYGIKASDLPKDDVDLRYLWERLSRFHVEVNHLSAQIMELLEND